MKYEFLAEILAIYIENDIAWSLKKRLKSFIK